MRRMLCLSRLTCSLLSSLDISHTPSPFGPHHALAAAESLVPLTSIALSSSMKPSTELLSSLLGSQSYQVRAAFTGGACCV